MLSRNIVRGWGILFCGSALSEVAQAGVISDAPSFSRVLLNILNFLLSVVGIVAILAIAIAGMMYLVSGGDPARAQTAKKYAWASVIGLMIALGALIIVRQISRFLV